MNMHLLHIGGGDRLLPAHAVRQRGPIGAWLVSLLMSVLFFASIFVCVALIRAERARVDAWFASQDAVSQKITVVYDQGGIVCSVPRGQERAAAVVNQGCTSLAGALELAGLAK